MLAQTGSKTKAGTEQKLHLKTKNKLKSKVQSKAQSTNQMLAGLDAEQLSFIDQYLSSG